MSSEHVEVLREMKGWRMPPIGGSAYNAALDAAIAALSAQQPPAEAQPVASGWCDACEGAGHTPDAADPFARPVCCPDCAGSGLAEHSITANDASPPSAPVGVEAAAIERAIAEIESGDFDGGVSDACLQAMKAALAQQPAACTHSWHD